MGRILLGALQVSLQQGRVGARPRVWVRSPSRPGPAVLGQEHQTRNFPWQASAFLNSSVPTDAAPVCRPHRREMVGLEVKGDDPGGREAWLGLHFIQRLPASRLFSGTSCRPWALTSGSTGSWPGFC